MGRIRQPSGRDIGIRHPPHDRKRRLHVFGRPVERGHRLQFVARLMIVALEITVDGVVLFPLAREYAGQRSEEHTSELQSLMRISYAVFCLKKKQKTV